MKSHLPLRIFVLLVTLLLGVSETTNLFAQYPEGAVHGLFSVSYNTQVFFSQGNLQYIGSASTPFWKFADHQWDYLGTTTGQNSSNQNKDRDLFGWGTSGYNHGAVCYQPWSTGTTNSNYYAYGNFNYNLSNQTGQADWGFNAISNGGNQENSGWRTLTDEEWSYVFNTRSTNSGIRYAKAQVNNINGVILLPDDWSANYYALSYTNQSGASFTGNTISALQWNTLEQHGAVFLPAAGFREGVSVSDMGSEGRYWSSSSDATSNAWCFSFNDSYAFTYNSTLRPFGHSVRLVRLPQVSINATPNPVEGGTVNGIGSYEVGTTCTLTAMPLEGYVFANWTENGEVVSSDATYSFVVLSERNLVANFVAEGNIVFADANVKTLCVANWDTNGDGELSYAEAALVTSLSNVFRNNTTIHSFNELSYFISLNSIGDNAFYGCSALSTLNLPTSVATIGKYAFYRCSALSVFNLPNSVITIGEGAFKDCTGFSGELIIPNSVTTIGDAAFSGCSGFTGELVIPNSVTTIGDAAFYGCSGFTGELVIPNSVTAIGWSAFYGCSGFTGELVIPNSVTTIEGNVFSGCSGFTGELVIPNSVTTIGKSAFYGCSGFTGELVIPNSVTAIGWSAFYGCSGFTGELVIPNSVTTIEGSAFSGCSGFTGELVIPNSVTTIEGNVFSGCSGFTGELVIPNSVTTIGKSAFYGCSGLTQVTIPENITYVGSKAFWNCPSLQTIYYNAVNCGSMIDADGYTVFSNNSSGDASSLTCVVIGSSVQRIPNFAFCGCSALSSINLPNSVTTIGDFAFYGCSALSSLNLPNSVTTIGDGAFLECAGFTGELVIPNSVTAIGCDAFSGCSGLTQVTIPENVTSLGYGAFICSSLQTVYYNAVNCETIDCSNSYKASGDSYSVFGNAITRVVIGNSVQRIPDYAFQGNKNLYQRLVIPPSVTEIGNYAFSGCNSLVQMVIRDNNLIIIGNYAFYGCSTLSALNLPNSVTTIGEGAFGGCTGFSGELVIPNSVNLIGGGEVGAFEGCSGFTGELIIPNSVTSIGEGAFYGCTGFTGELVIPNSVTSIGEGAFYGCTGFTGELVIPNSVTTIGGGAFSGCTGFTGELVIPNTMGTIEYSTFEGCSGFTGELIIPNSVTTIGGGAFRGCTGFTGELVIPDSVTTIGGGAFQNCSNLTGELNIVEAISFIGDKAFANTGFSTVNFNATNCNEMGSYYDPVFAGCNNLITLNIGENVEVIPAYAFYNCSGLTGSLVIPDNVTVIDKHAFRECTGLNGTLTIGNSVTEIGTNAFCKCYGLTGELTIPNSVGTIGVGAFMDCAFTGVLTIGSGVTSISKSAFRRCSGITEVQWNAVNCTYAGGDPEKPIFNECSNLTTLVFADNVATIPNYAFYHCYSLTCNLYLPNSLETIGGYAFCGCSGLTGDVVIPQSVTTLGQNAFEGCSGFDGSLVLGSGVQTISNYVFSGCSGFVGSLIVGRQVNSIGSYAFQNCSGFTTLISEHPTPPAVSNNSFNGMNYDIPVYVPFAKISNYQSAAEWSRFTYYKEQCVFDMLDNDLWSDENNWYAFELPGPDDVVCINSNCHLDVDASVLYVYVLNLNDVLTINSGTTLATTYGIGILQPSQLVIEEEGQLVNGIYGLFGAFQKQINGYDDGNDGWYTISAPFRQNLPVGSLTIGDYDLYAYYEPTAFWKNCKAGTNTPTFIPGQGCLYAHKSDVTMQLQGQFNASNAAISVPVTCQNSMLPGFNLLGNPYTNNIDISSVRFNDTPITTYYKAVGGSQLVVYTDADDDAIKPTEGFFVKVPSDGTVHFNMPSRQEKGSYARLVLSKDGKMLDRAYLRMDEGEGLDKAIIANHPGLLYLISGGQPMAVAPRHAKAYDLFVDVTADGAYTVESSLLGATCDYLHLIDRLTGEDIDLLATPSYTFEAKSSDVPNRFVLVLAEGAQPEACDVNRTQEQIPVLPSHGSNNNFSADPENNFVEQTLSLVAGWNWCSFNVDITLDDLKAAVIAATPGALPVIKSKGNGQTAFNGAIWTGALKTLDLSQMYEIKVANACTVTLEGMPVNPADHPATIKSGANWIAYPLSTGMSVTSAFAGFSVKGDNVKSKTGGQASWNEVLWTGALKNLVPGQGYIYTSAASENKEFVFPTGD